MYHTDSGQVRRSPRWPVDRDGRPSMSNGKLYDDELTDRDTSLYSYLLDAEVATCAPCGLGSCRISPPRFLAESGRSPLNQGSFVVLYFVLFNFSGLYLVTVACHLSF